MSGILLFSPHPDDVEFTLGGTILKHSILYPVEIVVMTDGAAAANGSSKLRRLECEKISSLYPNIHYTYMDFSDMGVEKNSKEQQILIVRIIRQKKPGIVVVPSEFDIHPDHVETKNLVERCVEMASCTRFIAEAGRPYNCKFIVSYRFPGKSRRIFDTTPKLYIDVSEVYDKKRTLIQMFKSQISNKENAIKTEINTNLLSVIEANDILNGSKIGTQFAEEVSLIKGYLAIDNLFRILF
ncbi:PIG-L deacetylase family protein [Ruminococcus sp. Marseille-P328]|jgi:LmbE family N-acetylglucosaminyl deacetylase|uniref:PIG-L deacetylase family protein n=1 Tax=Ruminococcus sp. Marseille-P328 TaxID=1816688 RepID=UPI003566221C